MTTARHTPSSLACLLAALLLAGCSGLRLDRPLVSRDADWPTAGRTAARPGNSTGPLRPPLRQAWELDLGAGFPDGSPVVVDSVVLVGNLRGDLAAVHLGSGRKIGNVRLGDAVAGSPAVDGGVAVIPLTGSGESLAAYNLQEGRLAWKVSFGDVEMSPLVRGGRVYAGTPTGEVHCLSLRDGTTLWKYQILENTRFLGFHATPAGTDSLVYFGGDDGTLYAFSTGDGSLRWRTSAGTAPAAGLALAVLGNNRSY